MFCRTTSTCLIEPSNIDHATSSGLTLWGVPSVALFLVVQQVGSHRKFYLRCIPGNVPRVAPQHNLTNSFYQYTEGDWFHCRSLGYQAHILEYLWRHVPMTVRIQIYPGFKPCSVLISLERQVDFLLSLHDRRPVEASICICLVDTLPVADPSLLRTFLHLLAILLIDLLTIKTICHFSHQNSGPP